MSTTSEGNIYTYDRKEAINAIIADLFGRGYSTRSLLEFGTRYMDLAGGFAEKITNLLDKGVRGEIPTNVVDSTVNQFMSWFNHFRFLKIRKEYKKYGMLIFREVPWDEIPIQNQQWFREVLELSLNTRLDILEGKTTWRDYE